MMAVAPYIDPDLVFWFWMGVAFVVGWVSAKLFAQRRGKPYCCRLGGELYRSRDNK